MAINLMQYEEKAKGKCPECHRDVDCKVNTKLDDPARQRIALWITADHLNGFKTCEGSGCIPETLNILKKEKS